VGGLSGSIKNSFFLLIIDGMKAKKKAIDVEVWRKSTFAG
jgi:hypothetical protein